MVTGNVAFYRELGRRIAAARKTKEGLTQERLAGVLGLSRPSIVNIEHGRQAVQVHQLVALADALGVGVAELLPVKKESANVEAMRPKLAKFDPQRRNWVEKVISTNPNVEKVNDDSTAVGTSPAEGARPTSEGADQDRARPRRRSRA